MGLFDHLFKPRTAAEEPPSSEPETRAAAAYSGDAAGTSHAPDPGSFLHPKTFASRAAAHPQPALRAISFSAAERGEKNAAPIPGEIVFTLGDVLSRIPTQLLNTGFYDAARELRFAVSDLSADLARGRAAISLSRIAALCPELFAKEITAVEDLEIRLPLQKLVEQIGLLRARADGAAFADVRPPAEVAPPPIELARSGPSELPLEYAQLQSAGGKIAPASTPMDGEAEGEKRDAELPKIAGGIAAPAAGGTRQSNGTAPARTAAAMHANGNSVAGEMTLPRAIESENQDRVFPAELSHAALAPARAAAEENPASVFPPLASDLKSLPVRAAAENNPRSAERTADALAPGEQSVSEIPAAEQTRERPEAGKILQAEIVTPPSRVVLKIPAFRVLVPPPPVFAASDAQRSQPDAAGAVLPARRAVHETRGGDAAETIGGEDTAATLAPPQVAADGASPIIAGKPDAPSGVHAAAHDAQLAPAAQQIVQELFMTDEALDFQKIGDLIASLPGVHACLLAVSGASVRAGDLPATIDETWLQTCGAKLIEVARTATKTSALGALRTVTICGDGESLSLFQRGKLCLCVVHGSRAFFPGVREKLCSIAEALMP